MELPSYEGRKRISRLPSWLLKKVGEPRVVHQMKKKLRGLGLATVCEEARCPNLGECWEKGTATIMVLGEICTRHCGFCAVTSGLKGSHDPKEAKNSAKMVSKLGLRHVVITMVARDDLDDGGAAHMAEVIREVRKENPKTMIEVLTSDFQGSLISIRKVVEARPDFFNHNIETVRRLTPLVRHRATYERSLDVLIQAKKLNPQLTTKSGLMLGLGERPEEVEQTLQDLVGVGCEVLTVGQYLQPSSKNLPVVEFVKPEIFEGWRKRALEIGFKNVASSPFVRSSYQAEELVS